MGWRSGANAQGFSVGGELISPSDTKIILSPVSDQDKIQMYPSNFLWMIVGVSSHQ